ncbi:MAG: inositol monophosphatase family protein [Myxococcales bacterium]|nr:inositol monophosphatase family protein [Myxococcales bacterium]
MAELLTDPDTFALLNTVAHVDELARLHFERGLTVQHKADGSPVTDADLACESALIDGIQGRFPGDSLCSEERGRVEPAGAISGWHWLVDPIDGTSALVEGLAHWGPTVARLDRTGRVRLAVTSLPRLRETWLLHDGTAWFGGNAPRSDGSAAAWRRLAPLAGREPPRVLYVPSGMHLGGRLSWPGKARCLGGTAAHLALVASGSAAAAFVGPSWQTWDVATGLALIDAVGGVARRVSDGAPLDLLAGGGAPFIAGNPEAVERLIATGAFHAT